MSKRGLLVSASTLTLGLAALLACSDEATSATLAAPSAGAEPSDAGAVAVAPAFACDRARSSFLGSPLGTRCGAIVDEAGRTVLLHGVNARVRGVFDVSFDDGRAPLEVVPEFGDEDARRMRALGYNALRLPINWSGLEPTETSGFKTAYLDEVARVVDACARAGLLVLLDIHQDAYSKEIGEDGAPLWAIVPSPAAKLGGPLTDLGARRTSSDVLGAFDTFFGASTDGARLRGRFAAMAAHVAARFAESPAVLGIELFNEPVAPDPLVQAFYAEVLPAVRAAAPKKLVFFEPSVFRGFSDESPLGAGPLGAGTVYAPHVYTKSFDATEAELAGVSLATLRPSNASARREADSFEAPLVITEYGLAPSSPYFKDYMRWQMELQDEALASSFAWVWKESSQGSWGFFDSQDGTTWTERPAVIEAMRRVRLEAAAGKLEHVSWDESAGRFEARVMGDPSITKPNLVALGGALVAFDATCDGKAIDHDARDPVALSCGGAGEHFLVLQRK